MPDVDIDVFLRDRTGAGIADAVRGLDRLGDRSKMTQSDLDELGQETRTLERRMNDTRAAATALGRAFARTGNTSLLRDMERLTREANRLDRALGSIRPPDIDIDVDRHGGATGFRKLFGNLVEGAGKAGKLAGDIASDGFVSTFKALPPEAKAGLVAALAGAAALAAPVIVATVDAAILLGLGGGGLAAGIALAARDPAVAKAYADLGHDIMKELEDSAAPFRGELIAGADTFGDAFAAQAPRIRSILANLSTLVDPLSKGLADGFEEAMPGVEHAIQASLPLVRDLAAELKTLGTLTGDLFDAVADAGPGAELVFKLILAQVNGLVIGLTLLVKAMAPVLNTIAALGDMAGLWDLNSSKANQAGVDVEELRKHQAAAGQSATTVSASYDALSQNLGNTAVQADMLKASYDRLFNETMNLDQANLQVKQGVLDLKQAVKDNGTTLDESTQKGVNNAKTIQSQVNALVAKRDAEIAAGNGTKEATEKAQAAYAGNLASLRSLLTSLGFAKADVDRLIGSYEELAKPRSTSFTTVFRTQGTIPPGYGDAKTGHSRTGAGDFGGLSTWGPARFAEGQRAEMAGDSGGNFRTGGPVQLHSEHTTIVNLDSRPFREYVATVVTESVKRTAWRDKVGKR